MASNTEKPVEVPDLDLPRFSSRVSDAVQKPSVDRLLARRQPDLLLDSLAYAIKRTQVRCDEALSHYLKPGLSPARFAALSTVGANPGISQTELGKTLNIGGAAVVKVVNDLQGMKLVERVVGLDRRVNALQLTDQGVAEIQEYRCSIGRFEMKIASQLTSKERSLLLKLLSKVESNEV